jgi:peptide/nickel transport system substrate-binding protein
MPSNSGSSHPSRSKGLSRRTLLLGGAGFATAAAAGSVWAATRGTESTSSLAPGEPASTPATARPTPTPPPQGAPNGVETPSGKAALYAPWRFAFDTLDAVRTGERSAVEILGRTHSRIVTWDDPARAALHGDLAETWELVDELTWVFKLRPDAQWQSRPGLEQRPFVAADAVDHFERAISLARDGQLQASQRPWDYSPVQSIEAPDDETLLVRTTKPYPHLLSVLAGPFALVQRPEAVPLLEADGNDIVPQHVSGTGPFRFEGADGDGSLQFSAAAIPPHGPRLASLRVFPATTNSDSFLARRFDEYVTHDRRDAAEIRTVARNADIVESTVLDASPVISSLHVGSPPWDDANLRLAISGALNRAELAQRLFGGRARPSGHLTPAHGRFALDDQQITMFPGYRTSFDEDARDARARWEAGAGDALGPLTIDFPSIFDPLYSASSIVPGILHEVLGVQVTPRVDSYVNIARRAAEGGYGNGRFAMWFGWAPAITSPDPSRALIDTYSSSSAAAIEAGFSSSDADALVAQLDSSFELEEWVEHARELERHLLSRADGGIVPWVQQEHEHFRWAYLSAAAPTPFDAQHLSARAEVDESHSRYPPERRV